jgi:DNA polymerase-4
MDAFYASVEQLDRPELRGKPVVVGGSPEGRGVVAAASYEARAFGVRSAMPMGAALRHCPQAIRVAPRFHRYHAVSSQVMAIFRSFTQLVEPLSLDEAYLDVSHLVTTERAPREIAQELKGRVKGEVGINVTVGAGTSKSVAKIASQLAKPDGLLVVEAGTEGAFLAGLAVELLWGIGPKTGERLRAQGIATIGQLAQQPEEWFRTAFGKRGPELRQKALGRDDSPVVPFHEAKSHSAERTFPRDLASRDALFQELERLVQRVAGGLKEDGLQGKTVTVKIRLADFTTFTRQTSLPAPTSDPRAILETAQALLERELQPGRPFRLLGAGVSNFGEEGQLSLFP